MLGSQQHQETWWKSRNKHLSAGWAAYCFLTEVRQGTAKMTVVCVWLWSKLTYEKKRTTNRSNARCLHVRLTLCSDKIFKRLLCVCVFYLGKRIPKCVCVCECVFGPSNCSSGLRFCQAVTQQGSDRSGLTLMGIGCIILVITALYSPKVGARTHTDIHKRFICRSAKKQKTG